MVESAVTNNNTNSIEMLFSIKSMQSMVENIGVLIQHDVVICSREGVIIAASRKSRVGLFNTKVKEMIENGTEMHIVATNCTDKSFRPGVNLPVRYQGAAIGAVGITGEPEEVKVFCRIVQSFVEQQLVELTRERSRAIQRQVLNNFVHSWVFRDLHQDDTEFDFRSRSLGINTHIPRIICVIDCKDGNLHSANADQFCGDVQQHIEKFLKDLSRQHVVAIMGSEIVVLLSATNISTAKELMKTVQLDVQRSFGVTCAIGIGSLSRAQSETKISYEAAKQACEASRNTPDREIFAFDLYDMDLLVSTLDRHYKQRIYNYTFREYKTDAQIAESVSLLQAYIDTNRSISKTADALFLHKNTVQFRLGKICELTGYDPRNTRDLTFLYTIVLIHKMGTRKTNDALF